MITGNSAASISEGTAWLHALMRDVNIPTLSQLCPQLASTISGPGGEEEVQNIVTATMAASSTKGNPVLLSREQFTDILLRAL